MRLKWKWVFAGLVLTLLVASSFGFVARRRWPPPNIGIRFVGYVQGTGSAVFSLSNGSSYAVLYSGEYRIQRPTSNGWILLTRNVLPTGGSLLPGRSESVQVVFPPGEREWRVDVDFTRDPGTGRRSVWYERARTALGNLGLSILEPRVYGCSSGVVRD